MDLTTTAGDVAQGTGATLIAGSLTSSGGIAGALVLGGTGNKIGTLAAVTTGGALAVVDSVALTLAGPVVAGAGGADFTISSGGLTEAPGSSLIAASLTSSGGIAGPVSLTSPTNRIGALTNFSASGLTLVDSMALTLANTISVGAAGTIDITTPGGINQAVSGVAIAGTLTSSGGLGGVSLLGVNNQIGSLSTISVGGGLFRLSNSIGLRINAGSVLSGHEIDLTAPVVTVQNGAQIVTDGIQRPTGLLQPAQLPTATENTNGGAYFTVGDFRQSGVLSATNLSGGFNILRIDATGTIAFDPTTGFKGPNTWLILGIANGAASSGAIDVKALDINFSGATGSASLLGTINGISGESAAGLANIEPAANANFRINSCAVHSVNCVLFPIEGILAPAPNTHIVVAALAPPSAEDTNVVTPLVSDGNDILSFTNQNTLSDDDPDDSNAKRRTRRTVPP